MSSETWIVVGGAVAALLAAKVGLALFIRNLRQREREMQARRRALETAPGDTPSAT